MPSSSNLKCWLGSTKAELMTGFSMTAWRTNALRPCVGPAPHATRPPTPRPALCGVYRRWVTDWRARLGAPIRCPRCRAPVLLVPSSASLEVSRQSDGVVTESEREEAPCKVTSGSAARAAGSTSPTSACTRPSAARAAAGGSGSSGGRRGPVPSAAAGWSRPRSAAAQTKAGFATQQGGPGGDEQGPRRRRGEDLRRRRPSSRLREYLKSEWLPAIEATIRPSTYRSYKQHVECHICPHIGSVQLQKLSGSQINALYAKLALAGKKDGKTRPLPAHHPPRARRPAPGAQGRGALGAAHAQPHRGRRPAAHQRRRHQGAEDLGAPSS